MKKERGFVKAKLILRGVVFSHTPGTQASKNIPVSIGLNSNTMQTIVISAYVYHQTVNPIDTGIFFDACVPGCVKNHTPLKINFAFTKPSSFFMR